MNFWILIGAVGRVLVILLFAALFMAPLVVSAVENCSWDYPGHNRFTGEVPAAVDRYTDIPADVRARLKARLEKRQYDDVAVIRRDSIMGYDTMYRDLREMHFGSGQVCKRVSRDKWTGAHQELGLVYCEGGHCLLVPTVCSNVSRVTIVPGATLPPVFVKAPPLAPPGGDFTVPFALLLPEPTPPGVFYAPPRGWWGGFPPPVYVDRPWRPVGGYPPGGTPPVVTPPADLPPDVPPSTNPPGGEPPTVPPVVTPPTQPPVVTPPGEPPVVTPPPWQPPPPVSPPVPEPETLLMIALGLLLVLAARYREALSLLGLLVLLTLTPGRIAK